MNAVFFLILLFLHLFLCAIWFFHIRKRKSEALLVLPLVLCLPFVGVVCEWINSRTSSEGLETPVSKLYRVVAMDNMSVNTGRQELDTVVPFDEVMLLSNDQSRRNVMMHILRRDPFMYLEVLKSAKESSDVEVTHYATATIMEIQRDLDISMQNAETAFELNSDDVDAVNRYITALTSYINTGLLLENRMLQLRERLSEVLEHKLSIFPNSRSAHLLLIESYIKLRKFDRAAEVAAMLREKRPSDEASWLKSLHVCMASGDAEEKAQLSSKLKTETINWSRSGREEAEFLCGDTAGDNLGVTNETT